MLFGVLWRLHEYATGQEKELQIFDVDMLGFFFFVFLNQFYIIIVLWTNINCVLVGFCAPCLNVEK